jgi:hypothetical protein
MATPRKSKLPPPQIQLVDGQQKINRYWLDWFDNTDRVIVRTERSGSEVTESETINSNDRLVEVNAADSSIALVLPDPTGQNFDFIVARVDNNWQNTVSITANGGALIHGETTQYIWPDDTAHIQAMNSKYRFA